MLARFLAATKLINSTQFGYVRFCAENAIGYADVCKLPFANRSVDGIYACHVAEHLSKPGLAKMLAETKRCLVSGGWLRLAVPDLKKWLCATWNTATRTFSFTTPVWQACGTSSRRRKAVFRRCCGWIPVATNGCMSGISLGPRMTAAGFDRVAVLEAGATTIAEPLGLDLRERAFDSVYVEAYAP